MQIPLICGWTLSVVLTKGKYSSCLNPHIGIFNFERVNYKPTFFLSEKKKGSYMITFPQHWFFNVEWNWKKRMLKRKMLGRIPRAKKSVREILKLYPFQIFLDHRKEEYRIYIRNPFGWNTKCIKINNKKDKR